MRKPSQKGGPEPKPEGTLLSSIHRAKGLEAKRVFILRSDLLPHPMAKSEWAKGQEKNLSYVAKTRAIETLVYVDGVKGG
jgi:superfamily I DNA/RNA helicase